MNWKRALIIGIGWGVGTGVVLGTLLGIGIWYDSRPKPPKPWNATAVTAEFDTLDTDGENNNVTIVYTLENHTDFDYRLADKDDVTINGKLSAEKSLSADSKELTLDFPVFLPAHKRIRLPVHVNYPYQTKLKANPTSDERHEFRKALAKFISTEWANLDGFEILDDRERYEIDLPPGWKTF